MSLSHILQKKQKLHRWSRWVITFCTWPRRLDPLRAECFLFCLLVSSWKWKFGPQCRGTYQTLALQKKQALKESYLFFILVVYIEIYISSEYLCVCTICRECKWSCGWKWAFFFLKKTWGCTLSSLATVQILMMAVGSSSPRLLALLQYFHKCPTVAPVNTSLGFFLPLRLCCKWLAFIMSPANL